MSFESDNLKIVGGIGAPNNAGEYCADELRTNPNLSLYYNTGINQPYIYEEPASPDHPKINVSDLGNPDEYKHPQWVKAFKERYNGIQESAEVIGPVCVIPPV